MSYYGTRTEADTYFNTKLYRDMWFQNDPDMQVKALTDATERIDQLNFYGDKTSDSQLLQFPRNGEDTVPISIKRATFEIAFQLLDGRDPEIEYQLLRKSSTGIGPSRSNNDTQLIPQHTAAGIPSLLAWSYIRPFLRNSGRIALKRS